MTRRPGRVLQVTRGRWLIGLSAVLWASASSPAQAQGKSEKRSWFDPILIDIGGGIPAASSQETRFIGDGMAGYVMPSFGVVARGSTFYYTLDNDAASTDTTHNEGSVEGWYSIGAPGDTIRLQLHAEGGSAWYDATYIPRVTSAGTYHDEDSMMGRGNLLVGIELSADNLNGYLLAGGGVQWESYDYVKFDPNDPNLFSSTTDTTARGVGRMQLRWSFVPATLSTRLRGEGSYFSLTRDNVFVRSQANGSGAGQAQTRLHQLELKARLSFELDVLAFAGMTPYVVGGLDHVGMSGDAGSSSITIPSVGVGFFKPAWY